jgi:hypothetical protein
MAFLEMTLQVAVWIRMNHFVISRVKNEYIRDDQGYNIHGDA